MGKKVRKQVTLSEDEAAALARRANELGISEAELIRHSIQAMCLSQIVETSGDSDGEEFEDHVITASDRTELLRLLDQINKEGQERLAARGGKLYPSSWEDIRRDREERSERWR